jgi:hypothetical protein
LRACPGIEHALNNEEAVPERRRYILGRRPPREDGEVASAASGPVAEAPGEKWREIDQALRSGFRGLQGGDSLARLLDRRRRGNGDT